MIHMQCNIWANFRSYFSKNDNIAAWNVIHQPGCNPERRTLQHCILSGMDTLIPPQGFEENIWSQDPRDIAFVWLRPWGKFKTQHCRKQLAGKACMVWGSVLYLELRFEIPLYCCSCWTKLVNSIIIENHEGIAGIHLSTSNLQWFLF